MSWLRTTGLRLALALGLAFALWVFVGFTQNPEQQSQLDARPLNVEGLSPGLVIVDSDSTPRASLPNVTIDVQADEQTINALKPGDLRAFVDVTGRGPGEHNVPINVTPTRSGLTQLRITTVPDRITMRIEQEITRTVPLTVEVTGNVPFSFEQRPAQVTANGQPLTSVQVSGPDGRASRVERVRALANIDRLTANYSSPRPLEALAKDGQVISGIAIHPESVNVLVPIVSSAGVKRVPIVPLVVGSPASGYVVAAVSVSPQFVTLAGNAGGLEKVESVATASFDVARANGSISQTVSLLPPPGAIIQTGEPTTATVTIEVRPINQPFVVTLPVPVAAINAPEGLVISYNPQVVQVALSGGTGQLATIQSSSLQAILNLRGLTPGTYTFAPTVALPPGVQVRGTVPKITVTVRLLASPVPSPTATSAPTSAPPTGTPLPATTPQPAPSAVPPSAPSPAETSAPAPPAVAPTASTEPPPAPTSVPSDEPPSATPAS